MTTGKGKYDDDCTKFREDTEATGVLVVVFDGKHGNGFSVQCKDLYLIASIPQILRNVANEIDNDLRDDILKTEVDHEKKD